MAGLAPAPGRADPASPPAVTVLKNRGQLGDGLIFISPQGNDVPDPAHPVGPGPEIIDNQGRPVWYSHVAGGVVWAMDFQVQSYQGKPVLTWTQGTAFNVHPTVPTVDYILDSSYNVVATVQAGNGLNANQHEFQLTPQNTALIAIYNLVTADLSAVGGSTNGKVYEAVVQEVDVATGKVLLEWHSLKDVPVTDSYKEAPSAATPDAEYDYFHLNSINLDTDGNLLISSRHTWTVYKINRTTGAVMWRLGGKRSSFALGPGVAFAWQHHPVAVDATTIRIFDNESNGTPVLPYSRVIWVKRDETAMTATLVRSIQYPDALISGFMGSAQGLSNGDTMIGWGEPGRFSEFDASGQLTFDAELASGYNTYRAYRFPWVGTPTTSPTVTVRQNADGTMTVHVLWNGATEVAKWQVLGGAASSALQPVATVAWNGLDTTIPVSTQVPFVQLIALNAAGATIGTSTVVNAPITAGLPVITAQPVAQAVASGASATLSVATTSSTPVALQWYLNGSAIAGATQATYAVPVAQSANAGSYTVSISNAAGSVTTQPALLRLLSTARLTNLAVRTAMAANQRLIVGFTINGGGENVLLRAAGPSLAQFGVRAFMPDPKLEVFQGTSKIAENAAWSATLSPTFAAVGAFPLTSGSQDSALVQSFTDGGSAQVSGAQAGLVLEELYEVDAKAGGRLVNLSARNQVGTGENVLIAGFHIGGTGTLRVLLRAVGSTLTTFGVPNVLVAPKLELYDAAGTKLGESQSWDPALATTFANVGAFALPAGSKDAAMLVTLAAGKNYTVQVSGVSGETGEALIEIYEAP
jgi:hypothetical protein